MAHNYVSPHALCPFYSQEQPRALFCEGPFPGSSLRLGFRGSARNHKQRYCCADWEDCPLARMLWAGYGVGPMIERKDRLRPAMAGEQKL